MLTTELIKTVSPNEQKSLLKKFEKDPRSLSIYLLMLDAGLRASEVGTLKIGYINFYDRSISLPSLKKRSAKPIFRSIPMTDRLTRTLSLHVGFLKSNNSEDWLFPADNKNGHLDRRRIHEMMMRKSSGIVHPHMLRHTFATKIVNEGNDIKVAQKLLGHSSRETTEIYLHVSNDEKRTAIKSIESKTIWERIFPSKREPIILPPVKLPKGDIHRKQLSAEISKALEKKIHLYISGPQGVGKSYLLKTIQPSEKILKIDDMANIKKSLGGLALQIYKDKQRVIDELLNKADFEKVVSRESNHRIMSILEDFCKKDEYTILIDDCTEITKAGTIALNRLKNTFHIIACSREIKLSHSSFLSNFDRLEIPPFTYEEATKYIAQLSKPFLDKIKNYEAYKNHIIHNTNLRPAFIYDLVDRLAKEEVISIGALNKINHFHNKTEINFFIPLLIAVSCLIIFRYLSHMAPFDSDTFKVIGGIALIIILFARPLIQLSKKKSA